MKPGTTSQDVSLLNSFRALLPKGVSLLIGSVVLQCISVGMLVVIGVKLSQLKGLPLEKLIPPLMLGGTFSTLMLVTGVFLVVMQKPAGIHLCRFNAGLWTLLTGASLLYSLFTNDKSILTLSTIGLGTSLGVLALYSTRFLNIYINRAKHIRQNFWR